MEQTNNKDEFLLSVIEKEVPNLVDTKSKWPHANSNTSLGCRHLCRILLAWRWGCKNATIAPLVGQDPYYRGGPQCLKTLIQTEL